MPDPETQRASEAIDRLVAMEARLARIETYLGIETNNGTVTGGLPLASISAVRAGDELEFEVGQNWFAFAGVVVLTLGVGLLLALPFNGVPAAVPSLIGFGATGGLFALAHRWRGSFALVAAYVRGSAMALLFFSTLRLCFPAAQRVLDLDSLAARALLIGSVAFNLWIALRRKSPWLTGLALATGAMVIATAQAHWLAFGGLTTLVIIAVWICERENWRPLCLGALIGGYATYLAWTLGVFHGNGLHFSLHPVAPAILIACLVVFASGPWWVPKNDHDEAWTGIHATLNCVLGYGLFLVHTAAVFPAQLTIAHAATFVVLLGIAMAYWIRRQSRAATFFYAMTGYAALSVAILKASTGPVAFGWLSVQSLVVITTAIWFRSRFIIVANFFIFLAIVLAYIFMAERETGISLGFGLVALVSARILNWQKNRLELKTELMRNAYLLSAFALFPFALYHLTPAKYIAVAWVALALVYYGLNLMVRNQKFRWMGHATLLLTTIYVVVVGVRHFEPAYRVLSFLVLGAVLLVVSLSFTRARQRRPAP